MVKHAFSALLCLVNGLLIAVHGWAEPVANSAHHGVILQYHHIATDTPASTSLSPEVFRQHLEILKTEGYHVWGLPELVTALRAEQAVPDRVVIITFDDAYDDIATTAAPLLKEFGYPFTVFVSTDFVDRKQHGYMTWDQLRALQAQDVTLANHTRSHLHLLRKDEGLSDRDWLQALRREIDGAEQRIKAETGQNWRYFAYPYGEADAAIIDALQDWGYLGFGQQSGALDKRLLESGMAPRFPFNEHYRDLADFRVKASSLPLPVVQETFPGWVFAEAVIPELRLQLADHKGQLTCFASGQGPIKVLSKPQHVYVIKAPKPVAVGRSRYNCTLPVAGEAGRFHWYSRMWIRKRDDGSWYPEP
ncbi:MAG: polysaccharide deacetylase family protein [Ketobacter sp.]|nr:polysaccharide deacetylase family protein [Ketobacter sp.]